MKRNSYYIKPGNLNNFELVEENIEEPSSFEVQIEVKCIGLNFADVFSILGLYNAAPKNSFIPGLEYSGVVTKIGSDVKAFKIGDKIMGVAFFGAYTTVINSDYRYMVKLPDSWSFQEGASYLVQVLTAYYGLIYLGHLQKKENVLIHSAGGGVGIMANRIAKKFDCITIGTVGNKDKTEFCLKQGYDYVIVRSKNFKTDLINVLNGKNLNVIMECIGGKIFKDSFDVLAPQGRMIVYGFAEYMSKGNRLNYLKALFKYFFRPKIDIQKLNNKTISGFNLIYLFKKVELMHKLLEELKNLGLEQKPYISSQYDFLHLKEAIKKLQSGDTFGKIVINI
ncbi:MAG: zinc-binding dehydrogenase [Candidatus Paceibacterota bacterium]